MYQPLHLYNQGRYIHCTSQILFSPLYRFLNQAMKMFDATEVVPINFVFFTASAIVAGMSTLKLSLSVGFTHCLNDKTTDILFLFLSR